MRWKSWKFIILPYRFFTGFTLTICREFLHYWKQIYCKWYPVPVKLILSTEMLLSLVSNITLIWKNWCELIHWEMYNKDKFSYCYENYEKAVLAWLQILYLFFHWDIVAVVNIVCEFHQTIHNRVFHSGGHMMEDDRNYTKTWFSHLEHSRFCKESERVCLKILYYLIKWLS